MSSIIILISNCARRIISKHAHHICENQLISAFVFTRRIVQHLFFLNPKFQASSHPLWLHRPVYVIHGRKPEDGFFHVAALFVYDALDAYVFSQELM